MVVPGPVATGAVAEPSFVFATDAAIFAAGTYTPSPAGWASAVHAIKTAAAAMLIIALIGGSSRREHRRASPGTATIAGSHAAAHALL
jgi:hypothetical protein